ncbi:hypothetical protein QBC33DRAFT_480697 [Phialemonium atrogriseum]|uniref:HNH nuclease domain-containing protein n=1 Tax=Phialemonium atrogriseum TaxID=1093897 RepID=A0AAJ0BRX6_9PEZI|nr:uncharacterized protein QBC33DRAFT_480697 [Phialemonium atrogriseum]KAK1762932.1 hypothetical protein QBC33DRAFT_480697 [Phialemonium atrogriseum]
MHCFRLPTKILPTTSHHSHTDNMSSAQGAGFHQYGQGTFVPAAPGPAAPGPTAPGLGWQGHRPPPPPVRTRKAPGIRFCHPGYNIPNQLFRLPRVDTEDNQEFGVHHKTALVACQIIAGNRFNKSYLSLHQTGQPVQTPMDGVLTQDRYYFIIDGCEEPYPIVPSFRDWQFPHDCIPEYWLPEYWPAQPSPTKDSPACAVTGVSWATKSAHLVPREEHVWYIENSMSEYAAGMGGTGAIDPNPANIIPLRRDIHRCFDKRWFAIVPKPYPSHDPSLPGFTTQYVTHLLTAEAAEIWPEQHYVSPNNLHEECTPYLFARFAWAILLQVKPFITSGKDRVVIYVDDPKAEDRVFKTGWLKGAELNRRYGGGGEQGAKEKATTPSKRKKGSEKSNADNSSSIDDGDLNHGWVYRTGWLSGAELYRRYAGGDDADKRSNGDDQGSNGDDEGFETTSQDD